jgi:hypothetical protein
MRDPRIPLAILVTGSLAISHLGCKQMPTTATTAAHETTPNGGGGGGAGTAKTPVSTGPLQVSLTDDPLLYPFLTAISIQISKIEVRPSGGDYLTLEDWGNTPGLYELLGLVNGQTRSVLTRPVPAGAYDSMRVTFAGAHVRTIQGILMNAPAPGSTIEEPIALQVSSSGAVVLIDIDLANSITLSGLANGKPIANPGQISGATFSPVGRFAVVGSGGGISGSITDSTGARVAGATVRALSGGAEVASTATDQSGSYAFVELPPGTYSVMAESQGQTPANLDGIEVDGGATRTVSLVLSGATANVGQTPLPGVSPSPSPAPIPSPSPSPQPLPSPSPSPPGEQ